MRQAHLDWVLETKDIGLLPEPEIVAREQSLGNRYEILRKTDDKTLMIRLRDAASLAIQGSDGLPQMQSLMNDRDASIRYWAAMGMGNLGQAANSAAPLLLKGLKDSSPSVRVASARALCRQQKTERALPVLISELQSPHQWVRLNAAIVLDEIQEQGRPAIGALKQALKDKQNKYVVRVVNRALNDLLGTDNMVP